MNGGLLADVVIRQHPFNSRRSLVLVRTSRRTSDLMMNDIMYITGRGIDNGQGRQAC